MTDDPAIAPATKPSRRALGLVLAIALVVRTGILAAQFSALQNDPDRYRQLAENLVARGTFGAGDQPTAYRPPLWSLMLVPTVAGGEMVELRIAVLQLLLGLATVALVCWLTEQWHVGRAAWLAPLLVAIDPILLRQSTVVMTETLATLLAALALAALTWHAHRPTVARALATGVILGLACLCRPTFMPWLALLLPLLLLIDGSPAGKPAFKHAACVLLASVAILLPWTMRNYFAFGRPIIGTTHGGYTLLLGNNASFYDYARHGEWGTAWDATAFQTQLAHDLAAAPPADEIARDRLEYDQAWRQIEQAPGDFLRSAVLRLGYLFSPLPHRVGTSQSAAESWLRAAIGVFYLAEFALVIAGITSLRGKLLRAPWIWGVALVASFAAVHLLYWTDMRMRAPLVPFLALVAAAGLGSLAGQRSRS